MIRFLAALLVLALSPAMAAERMAIGYVDRADDPRHEDRMGFGGILLEQRGRADRRGEARDRRSCGGRALAQHRDRAGRGARGERGRRCRRGRKAAPGTRRPFHPGRCSGERVDCGRARHPRRDAVQCRGGRRCVARRRLPGANHARDSEPRDAHRCAGSVHRRPQVARHPGARRPRCTRRGRGARARALGQALRRADRGKAAVRAGQRSARARPEQSGAADRGAGL